MNTSFGNRYANTYFSPNNKGEAMRKMRQGVRLPGWGLPMNGGQTRSATYLNQYAGSPKELLESLKEAINREKDVSKPGHLGSNSLAQFYINQLEAMRSRHELTPEQENRLNDYKNQYKKIREKNSNHNTDKRHIPLPTLDF